MAESDLHKELVNAMYQWISFQWFNGDSWQVFVDDGDAKTGPRPPAVQGHRPDVYGRLHGSTGVIIGEAKTPRDLETQRSQDQLSAYLRYCADSNDSCLVVAVPWTHVAAARALLGAIKRTGGTGHVKSVVVSQLDTMLNSGLKVF